MGENMKYHGISGDVNIINEAAWLRRSMRSLYKSGKFFHSIQCHCTKTIVLAVPFVVPAAVLGAWLVYPGKLILLVRTSTVIFASLALTPEFKGRIGIGPKVEVEE